LIRQCPYSTRQKYTEATGNKLTNGSTIKDNNVVSNVTSSGDDVDIKKIKDTKMIYIWTLVILRLIKPWIQWWFRCMALHQTPPLGVSNWVLF